MRLSSLLPQDIGTIHLVGIGGIGMSGIAELLHRLGYKVSGSDLNNNANVMRLRQMGIEVFIGHGPDNIKEAAVVVKSTAVKYENPEIEAARKLGIPVIRRSEMLAELARHMDAVAVAGSHGKTTTTSLLGHAFDVAGLEPTVINGGIINAYGSNVHMGASDWAIIEADESDGTLLKIPATFGIITNIDAEHMDFWHDFAALKKGFTQFIDNLPFYGAAILCVDDPVLQEFSEKIQDRRIVRYALHNNDADIMAENIRCTNSGSTFDVKIQNSILETDIKELKDITIPLIGPHNVSNALTVVAMGLLLKWEESVIRQSLQSFEGVKRRFTITGVVGGITIIDDYGHHPNEIKATLKAAELASGNQGQVIAVVQPHRYSRLEDLWDEFTECFEAADKVVVAPVYAAGEEPRKGIDAEHLAKALNDKGKEAHLIEGPEQLASTIDGLASSGDYVVCLGAGSITAWANALPEELSSLRQQAAASSA